MTRISRLLWLGMAACATPALAQAPTTPAAALLPSADNRSISNGLITAVIYTGLYHGTRFDHAGVIGSLKLNGQEFYGPWFSATAPDVRDYNWVGSDVVTGPASSTMGPAEEFDPVGFDDASPGKLFLKIGDGLLIRPDDKPYDHFRQYSIPIHSWEPIPPQTVNGTKVEPGWASRSSQFKPNSATWTENGSGGGFGYTYTKTLTLVPGKPQLIISHVLRNTGTRPIVSSVYDHNFITVNPGQGNMRVTLPFAPPQATAQQRLTVKGNTITWPQPLAEGQTGSMTMSETPQLYDFTVTDTKTGASVRVQADVPASQYKLWSIKTVMAVEPYVAITVAPGAAQEWTYTYTYSAP